ncbi:squalene synthase HpnD [Spiribacter sp. C176]|uniref:Squalene synthase HpnD n=1 Tax=Spiribacter salilacus TaxID=2664894 RepID=A0A6N7QT09_9GAMM|nr:squalene/phytoene synthase family protein [Spiribacter salilacus]MRH77447.1 squalene synthase HpnD [Spiribacter salilacus]
MDPETYCRNKAAPEGSSLHYALLFAPQDQRQGLAALAALRAEILEVPREVSDAGIGAVKLTWWQEELQRLAEGNPRHPVTQALAPSIDQHALPLDGLNELIEAARMDLEYGSYPTLRELTLYCHRAGGSIAELTWRMGGSTGTEAAAFAHDLSIGLELTRMLRHLRRDLIAGRCYIPADELSIRGVTTEQILSEPEAEVTQSVLAQQARRARQFLDSAITQLQPQERQPLRYGLILAVLYRELLLRIEQDGIPVLSRQHHLTPLRKLWMAWKTANWPHRVAASPSGPAS